MSKRPERFGRFYDLKRARQKRYYQRHRLRRLAAFRMMNMVARPSSLTPWSRLKEAFVQFVDAHRLVDGRAASSSWAWTTIM